LRVLRSQIEAYITDERGSDQLAATKREAELRKIKREISVLKKQLTALQARRATIEKAISKLHPHYE
jgi:prefoldin subunit 5